MRPLIPKVRRYGAYADLGLGIRRAKSGGLEDRSPLMGSGAKPWWWVWLTRVPQKLKILKIKSIKASKSGEKKYSKSLYVVMRQ